MKLVCRIRPAKPSRKDESKVNIFSAVLSDTQPQTVVACTRFPITQKLIDEQIRTDQDILRYKSTILEQADLFQFDQVLGSKSTQQAFYSSVCAQKVSESVQGTSATFWLIGSNQSGKSYTLRGGDTTDKGIVTMAVDDILTMIQQKPYRLMCSVFAVNDDEMVDLIGSLRSDSIKQTLIKYLSDYKNLQRQALFQLKNYQKESPELQNTVIYSFYIQHEKQTISSVSFISHPQFTRPNDDPGILRSFIMNMANIQRDGDHSRVELQNKVQEAIYLLFNQSRFQNITLVANVSASQQQYMESFRCLQFFDDIRPHVKVKNSRNFGSELTNLKSSLTNKMETYEDFPPKLQPSIQQSQVSFDQTKHIQELKDLMREKEKLESMSQQKHRQKKIELKEEIKSLKMKILHLEDTIAQKDLLITQLERRSEDLKLQIDQGQQLFVNVRQKEGFYEKNTEELREIVAQLNYKVLDTERELQMARQRLQMAESDNEQMRQKELEYVKHYEVREDEFLQLLREERNRNQELINELDYFQKELAYRDENRAKLEDSFNTLKKVLDDLQKRYDEEKLTSQTLQEQIKKIVESDQNATKLLNIAEQKNTKTRTKLEAEVQQLKEDKLKYLKKYKAKISQLKPQAKQYETQINNMTLENLKLKTDLENSNQIVRQLENQLFQYQNEYPSMEKQNYTYQNELDRLQLINNQLSESYQKRSDEMNVQQSQLQQAIDHLERLTQQYEQVQQEYEKLQYNYESSQHEIKDLQQMLEKMCDVGHSQMDDLDTKINRLNQQLQQAVQEKAVLIKENQQIKQELQEGQVNEQMLERHVQKLKKELKYLKRQLGDVNNNLNNIIVEKNSELRSNSKLLSQNMSYRSAHKGVDQLLSSASKRDFLLVEDDSMSDI